jgi:hypothetical protein
MLLQGRFSFYLRTGFIKQFTVIARLGVECNHYKNTPLVSTKVQLQIGTNDSNTY